MGHYDSAYEAHYAEQRKEEQIEKDRLLSTGLYEEVPYGAQSAIEDILKGNLVRKSDMEALRDFLNSM